MSDCRFGVSPVNYPDPVRELILVFVTEMLTNMIIPAKTKTHHAWKKDIMLCIYI